jgi:Cu+-exporting ATPase
MVMNTNEIHVKEFSVQGMSCAGCAGRIERGLSGTPGVQRALVNFATHTAIVQSDLSDSEIQKKIEAIGYRGQPLSHGFSLEENQRREQKEAQRRMIVSVVLGFPVVVLGMIHSLSMLPWVRVLEGVLTFALLAGPGFVFFRKAVSLLRHRTANMDTLVALGAGISFVWSCIQALRGAEAVYFETAAAIVAFVLIGKYLEHRMTWRATSSLGALLQLQPRMAHRRSKQHDSEVETLDVRFVKTGDTLVTRVGERFPADGVVIEGQTEVDESLLTGESRPVVKQVGDKVVAGSLNKVGVVWFEAQAIGTQTRLGEIVKFVERTQISKAPIQRLADRVSAFFVPAVLVLSFVTFLFWQFILKQALAESLNAAVSVLVVACPCALGLATPIAVAIATGRAARAGILFRDLAALESLQAVQTIVFDKTGTLTEGNLSVVEEKWFTQQSLSESDRSNILKVVLQLEQSSQHPVATALVESLKKSSLPSQALGQLSDIRETVGQGMSAVWKTPESEKRLQVGRATALHTSLLPANQGRSWVVCTLNDEPVVAWSLSDVLRSDAAHVIESLKHLGVKSILGSGDQADVVGPLGMALEIEFHAQQTPQMKAELVGQLRSNGAVVAMIGDGVNDAPALAAADVGIAMGSGTDAAQQTASLTLKNTGLAGVLNAIALSKATFRNIRQNLGWAFGYNIVLMPLAMMGRLTPMWAAAAMAFSSLFVVLNALRLLRFGVQEQSSSG